MSSNLQLWQPAVGTSWQILLSNPIKIDANSKSTIPDVDVFTIDLFENPKTTVDTLHGLGKKVIAYFSAGSYEPGRPDSKEFRSSDLGRTMKGWEKEKWLNIKSLNVRAVMSRRIELAAEKGFDAIDPDNVDGYDNKNGLGLTKADSISFVNFLAAKAHSLNLSIGLKNAAEIIPSVLPVVDFAVNEQCVQYYEAKAFCPFIDANKPVFHIEYPRELKSKMIKFIREKTGPATYTQKFSTIMKHMELDGWLELDDGSTATTPTREPTE